MPSPRLDVRAELGKVLESDQGDLLREGVALILREVMEMEVARLAGATHYERADDQQAHRNGYRARRLDTRVGTLELEIPDLRTGPRYLPSSLEARKRFQQATALFDYLEIVRNGERRSALGMKTPVELEVERHATTAPA